MSIIKRIRDVFVTKQSEDKPKVTGYEAYSMPYSESYNNKNTKYLEELKGWVAACTTAIADEIASIQINLYQNTSKGVIEVEESPILDLLYRVNSFTTKFDHFWITQTYLELTGECPWFIERGDNGVPVAIYFLRPDKITPVVDNNQLISGYKYDVGRGKTVPLQLDEIIFLKYPDPLKPFRGKGTLAMAAKTVDIDDYSEDWNLKFYQNSARPDAVLKVKVDQMTDEQKDKLKTSLKKNYEGIEKAHKTMVLFGDMEFEKLGITQKDMDFLEQQRFSRDKILGIFRVPKAIIAQTEGVNFASAQVAQYTFAKWTIKPKMERLIQQLNEFLIPMFKGSEEIYLDYENPVPQDEEALLKRYDSGLTKGWMTINEVRSDQGLVEVEGGDVIYLPFNLVPVGEGVSSEPKMLAVKSKIKKVNKDRLRSVRARDKNYFKNKEKDEKLHKETVELVKQGMMAKLKEEQDDKDRKKWTSEEKMSFWKKKDAIHDKYVPKVKDKVEDIYRDQRKRTLSKLGDVKTFKLDSTTIFNKIKLDKKQEAKLSLKLTLGLFTELFKEAGNQTLTALDIQEEIDMEREEITKMLNAQNIKMSDSMTATTNTAMNKIVVDSIAEGETLAQLKKRLGTMFSEAEQYKAERVAMTETTRYNTRATLQAFEDSELVEAKEWFTNPGACPICIPMSGKTIGLKQYFFKKGDTAITSEGDKFSVDYENVISPPLHVNCRCDLVPVFFPTKSHKKYKHEKHKIKKN